MTEDDQNGNGNGNGNGDGAPEQPNQEAPDLLARLNGAMAEIAETGSQGSFRRLETTVGAVRSALNSAGVETTDEETGQERLYEHIGELSPDQRLGVADAVLADEADHYISDVLKLTAADWKGEGAITDLYFSHGGISDPQAREAAKMQIATFDPEKIGSQANEQWSNIQKSLVRMSVPGLVGADLPVLVGQLQEEFASRGIPLDPEKISRLDVAMALYHTLRTAKQQEGASKLEMFQEAFPYLLRENPDANAD